MSAILTRFGRDRRGVAAVELALVLPVLAAMAFLSFEAWRTASRAQEMRDAVKAGAQYYMNGGADDVAGRAMALQAWQSPPPGAAITVQRACDCGGVAQACNLPCSGGAAPAIRVTLVATGTFPQAYFAPTMSTRQVVRVR